LKMQCAEHGVTGIREAALIPKIVGENKIKFSIGKIEGDWNPDDPRYDDLFPQHPLSRLRRVFSTLQPALRVDARTKSAPAFKLPEN